MRHQPRLFDEKGRRISRLSINLSAHPKLREAVERDAVRWNSSMSWVGASALAAFYDVDIVRPDEPQRKKNGKRRKRGRK